MNNTETIFWVVLLVGLMFLTLLGLNEGLRRAEYIDCIRNQNYSEQFEGFWISKVEKERCDSLGIEINALIK